MGQVAEGETYVIVVDAADGGVPARRLVVLLCLKLSNLANITLNKLNNF